MGFSATKVTVTQFENKANPSSSCLYYWDYWRDQIGEAFTEMLVNELNQLSEIEVYERQTIKQIYNNEHDLINSENTEPIEKGQFKKADITLAASVSEYEFCADKKKTNIDLGSILPISVPLRVGFGNAKAKVGIDLRVIDVRTGRIIKTIHTTGEAKRSSLDFDVSVVSHENSQKTPVPEAAREAIKKAVSEVRPYLVAKKY